MKTKIYKVVDGFDYNFLGHIGFNKTQPKGNPWWQFWVKMNWSGMIGYSDERININMNTHKCHVICELNQWTDRCKEKVNSLIEEGIIEPDVVEEIEES